ncbi:MAG: hypothetical protein ABGY42_14750 [bacterium]
MYTKRISIAALATLARPQDAKAQFNLDAFAASTPAALMRSAVEGAVKSD